MDGLFGYIAVFILGIICGAVFMRKTGTANNNVNAGGGLFGMLGRNRNPGMGRPMSGNNMMNQGMQRPGINPGMQQRPPGMMPGQFNQPPGGYGQQPNNYNQNNGGW